ncbi:MAG: HsdR family type I site-specific deoxyribonuclease [Chloroflexi bacterium]|nr:HsdR family type I site-specific deoxyribonuclease [Chloroflexota bacterium]
MFNEQNSVENFVRDLLCGPQPVAGARVGEPRASYGAETPAARPESLGWSFLPGAQLPRATSDVLVEPHLRDALVRLNPEIAARPDRADEVLYRLRAILLSVNADGLVRANEEFTAWLRGERSMPFGPHGEHTPVRLVDFEPSRNNRCLAVTQLVFTAGSQTRRFDLVLYINGIPLVVGEAKTPTRPAVSWLDGAIQVHDDYEVNVPAFFVPNVLSFATEGKTYRFGAIRMSLDLWAPWREDSPLPSERERGQGVRAGLSEVETAVRGLLRPEIILDILRHFTVFATDKQHRKIKIICRFQQYHAANQIVERVVKGRIKKGLIWHFQGSGKSLLIVFAAQKLRLHPLLYNPTVLVVVDRVDLDTQITGTFNAADVPNLITADSRETLETLLAQDARKIIITTIHKFAELAPKTNLRSNIIAMVDEAHRTQEGDFGRRMRAALPNAFFFGLTGTPINKRDRNTFWAFGAEEDAQGYLSRYSFEESIRDKATLPLHFEARLIQLRVDKVAIDEAYANLTGHLSEEDQANLAQKAAKMSVLVKAPERVRAIVGDIVQHYQEKIAPNGFKAMVVTFDREACVLYKRAMDEILPREASEIVMTVNAGESDYRAYDRGKDEEEKLLDRYRDANDPLQFLIVTSRLLTGFDAPILQAMYLDKPMKEHNLLQGICRVNRPYAGKSHGLIVDYIGVFDDVARTLAFDEAAMRRVITNLAELHDRLPAALAACLAHFPGVDRTVVGYEGLMAAQTCLPDDVARDAFAADFSKLAQLWEALSPDPALADYEEDYRWLSQVYESVKPPSGNGRLLWHVLGAKTLDLIHANIHVDAVRDDLETLVMDADFLEGLLAGNDPEKAKEIEFQVSARIRRHGNHPRFIALGQRLEDLKDRLEQGVLTSLEYLKQLLVIAREVLQAEREVDPEEERQSAKAALTDLFHETRTEATPAIIERIVNDLDEIVRLVRFPGWQSTSAGEREVKQALRRTLLKYQLHRDQELFDKAYGYIREYY